jgi:hypothetical protein
MGNESFVRTVTNYGRPNDLMLVPKKGDVAELITPLLGRLLGLCTPNGTEHHIVNIIRSLPFVQKYKRSLDPKMGNYIIQVGESRTIFSCHMDIVGSNHKDILAQNKVEKIFFFTQPESKDNVYGMIWGGKANVDKSGKITGYIPSTLGADDKVGVYILLRMIEAGIPGTYLFHTGEECGGLGSAFLASNAPALFENKDRAIAFDRAGYDDVIGFQRGGRCCSTEFGNELAAALNEYMPPRSKFKGDARGTFTDTANFMKIVPECTNVSVGYFSQHGSGEHLDVYWLEEWLIPAILKIKYEELPTKRDPKEVTPSYTSYGRNHYPSSSNYDNQPKVPWDKATSKTLYMEFPVWKPELNIPAGASREVLITAMSRYLSKLSYGKEKDEFCSWIIGKLEHIDLLEEENIALNSALAMVNGPPKANPPDVILLPPPADYKRDTKIDFDFEEKVSLLTRLVVVADKVILCNADDQKWLLNYTNGAKKVLSNLGDKTSFTEKETTKVNRIIYCMAHLIVSAAVLSEDEEKLLMAVEKHICETHLQDGWFVPVGKNEKSTVH